jgi:hypothetical protein
MRRLVLPALLCIPLVLPLAAVPAQGQVLRSVVVPADAPVAVPPRGQALPPRNGNPAPGRPPAFNPSPLAAAAAAPAGTAPMDVSAVPAVLVPLVAAIILGGALAGGGGGGTSAPAVTR